MTSTKDLLAFEREWLNRDQHDGAKMRAAHVQFGLSLVRYYQALRVALDDPEAWVLDPVTCGVVRRRTSAAVRSTSLRRAG